MADNNKFRFALIGIGLFACGVAAWKLFPRSTDKNGDD